MSKRKDHMKWLKLVCAIRTLFLMAPCAGCAKGADFNESSISKNFHYPTGKRKREAFKSREKVKITNATENGEFMEES